MLGEECVPLWFMAGVAVWVDSGWNGTGLTNYREEAVNDCLRSIEITGPNGQNHKGFYFLGE